MAAFFYIVQIILAVFLVFLVLFHSPKGDGLGAMGSASHLFASQKGAEAGLNKITYWVAGIFMALTLLLGYGIIK